MSGAILLAITSFAVLATLCGWLVARPVHAAWLGLGMIVLEAANLPLSINYGIWLYPQDLFFLLLALACMTRFSLFASPRTVPGTWWLIGAIQLGLLVWGYRMFGSRAGVDFRVHFYLWVSVCYFCSVAWSEAMVTRILNGWVICALALCLLTFYRWIGSALDPVYAQEIMGLDTTGVQFRVVSASAALAIAIGFLILLFRMLNGTLTLRQRILLPVFLLTVIILQHRSVWVSLLVGIVCLLWIGQKQQGRWRSALGIGMLMLPLALFFAMPGSDNSVVTSIKTAAGNAVSTKEGTMVARMGNWQELLVNWATARNPVTYLVGMPYGGGYNPMASEDGEDMLDMVPHNHFVHILYRGGLLALGATVMLFYQLTAAAITLSRRKTRAAASCFFAIFAAFLAFFIPYWATYGSGILIGIAISYLGLRASQLPRTVRARSLVETGSR
ncbi:MAG: O-antigen ligase family protein [Pseudomonadota bacterium]|nr:O-antigen ligase family protein [Pseudomonadota bacterium]